MERKPVYMRLVYVHLVRTGMVRSRISLYWEIGMHVGLSGLFQHEVFEHEGLYSVKTGMVKVCFVCANIDRSS